MLALFIIVLEGCKVCGPYVVTLINWTPIFEWYMVRFAVKNGHWKGCGTMRLDCVLKKY